MSRMLDIIKTRTSVNVFDPQYSLNAFCRSKPPGMLMYDEREREIKRGKEKKK